MNLKFLILFIVYYSIVASFVLLGGGDEGFTYTDSVNTSDITSGETDSGGLFSTGVSFGRFVTMTFFGFGYPGDVPFVISTFLLLFQSAVTLCLIAFVIDSIWSG